MRPLYRAPGRCQPRGSAIRRGDMPDVLKPKRGIVTFESEGVESPGGKFHSRVLHVPGEASGVTIGRGYDMKLKSRAKIEQELAEARVPRADAKEIAKAAGLFGPT